MNNPIVLPYKTKFRKYQLTAAKAFLDPEIDVLLLFHPRRAGKDITALCLVVMAAVLRVGVVLYGFPTRVQAEEALWDGIDNDGRPIIDYIPHELIVGKPNKSKLTITLKNGSIIRFVGMDKYDRRMGGNAIAVVMSEITIISPQALDYFRPILTANKAKLIMIGTARGKNHAYDLLNINKDNPKWFTEVLTVENCVNWNGERYISEEQVENDRRSGMAEFMIQQEYYNSFDVSMPGAIYQDQLEQAYLEERILDFDIDPLSRVYTFWDLGWSDATAIWFLQSDGEKLKIINYYEANNELIEHYINYLNEFAAKNNLIYHLHFAPFDIQQHTGTFGSGLTRIQEARRRGIKFEVVPMTSPSGKQIFVEDGIHSAKLLFKRLWFHETNCKQGLYCLQNYQRIFDKKNKIFSKDPKHDWSSHGADALRYLAMGWNDIHSQPIKRLGVKKYKNSF